MAKPTASAKSTETSNHQPERWTSTISKIHSDLGALLQQNRAFSTARGARAIEEKEKLSAAADRFQKEDIGQIEDVRPGYARGLRKVMEDLRSSELETSTTLGGLMKKYGLAEAEQDLLSAPPPL